MSSEPLPPNIHLSNHPCLLTKLSQLRSHTTTSSQTKSLIHEITLILACEALATSLHPISTGRFNTTPLGYEYEEIDLKEGDFGAREVTEGKRSGVVVMPILRSGLGMVDAVQTLLPHPTRVHHLGLFRDKSTQTAVEYYNNLPYYRRASTTEAPQRTPEAAPIPLRTVESDQCPVVLLLDPIVATGATAIAAIETLRDWGASRIVMLCVLGTRPGLVRAASLWPEGIDIWVGGVDKDVDDRGMICPGVGDVGDRLFGTG